MYGLVNRAIQQMVTTHHREDVWQRIKERADLQDLDFFSTHHAYPDAVTHRLGMAASDQQELSGAQIMLTFGEYWITCTAMQAYEQLVGSTGEPMSAFLDHLDHPHPRAALAFPEIPPPSLRCQRSADAFTQREYRSTPQGLAPMVSGLLHGPRHPYRTPVAADQIVSRGQGDATDLSHVLLAPPSEPGSVVLVDGMRHP